MAHIASVISRSSQLSHRASHIQEQIAQRRCSCISQIPSHISRIALRTCNPAHIAHRTAPLPCPKPNPKSQTHNPKPETRNPKPETQRPQPTTHNPQRMGVEGADRAR
eukprot:881756-Rhodomonas_salina.1